VDFDGEAGGLFAYAGVLSPPVAVLCVVLRRAPDGCFALSFGRLGLLGLFASVLLGAGAFFFACCDVCDVCYVV